MTRLRLLAVLASAALLLAFPIPAAAGEAPATPDAGAIGAAADTASGTATERATPRQIRRALPSRNSLGRGVRSDPFPANVWCGARQVAGPSATAAAGALYTDGRTFEFGVTAEEHTTLRAAKQRFRAVSRQIRRSCPGFVVVGNELIPQRAAPLRRIGQQSTGIGFRMRNLASGTVIGEFNFSVHRIGRFVTVVVVNAPSVQPREYQAAMRQLETRLRRL
jgi:hypothetical protein